MSIVCINVVHVRMCMYQWKCVFLCVCVSSECSMRKVSRRLCPLFSRTRNTNVVEFFASKVRNFSVLLNDIGDVNLSVVLHKNFHFMSH